MTPSLGIERSSHWWESIALTTAPTQHCKESFCLCKVLKVKAHYSDTFLGYPQVAQVERPPMHEYIRKLLYKDLSKTTTEKVMRPTMREYIEINNYFLSENRFNLEVIENQYLL